MTAKPLPENGDSVRLRLDVREQNVEIPLLLEWEFALEPRRGHRNVGTPKRSEARVEMYRAIRSAGDHCDLTLAQLVLAVGKCERECQYALQDLLYLGWIEKLADVGTRGGLVRTGARKQGNIYRVTRPSWAWNGEHRKHLWKLAVASGVGVHTMHPSLQELFGLQKQNDVGAAKGKLERVNGRGAYSAPVPPVHRPKSPSLLLLKRELDQKRGKPKPKSTLTWPVDAKVFVQAWKDKYDYYPACDEAALAIFQEIKVGAGGAARAGEVALNFVGSRELWLVKRRHPMSALKKQWRQYVPLPAAKPTTRKLVQAAEGSLLDRLAGKSH